jgi:ribosome-associated toxin RatA of RatAB toxin-antitoxin module
VSNEQTLVVNAPIEKIWSTLLDFDSYPQWSGGVMEIDVLERDEEGRGTLIQMKVDAKFKKVTYKVRYNYDAPNKLWWDYIEGDLETMEGYYTFADNGDGTTTVNTDVDFEAGFWVPGPLKKVFKDQGAKNALNDLKRRAEA